MSNSILKELLKEYERKRIDADNQLLKRKNLLYSSNPELQHIDNELNSIAIKISKTIISSNDCTKLSLLENKLNSLKSQKKQLLQSLGKSEDYLKPKYECNVCLDTGYVLEGYKTTMCTCLKQKLLNIAYNKSNIGNLEVENFNTFNITLYSDIVDEKRYNSSISPRENIIIIKNICNSFINNFDNIEEKNLFFTGNTGLGKTFLSNCIAKELIEKGKTVLYQTAPSMLDSIMDYRFNKNHINSDFYTNILDVDLLIIDDLGTETINSMKFTELFNILNTRLLNQSKKITKTIISTNLTLQNIFSTYDERIVSRIVGYYNICKFFGEDIRFKKK